MAPHVTAMVGYGEANLGNVESARRYLWVAVDTYKNFDPIQCRFVLRTLAHIEPDPEKAALLIQLSCMTNNPAASDMSFQLKQAYYFCDKLDSSELAQYYLTRLWTEYPDKAQMYHGTDRLPALEESP